MREFLLSLGMVAIFIGLSLKKVKMKRLKWK